MPSQFRMSFAILLVAVVLSAISPTTALGRTAGLSGSWSALGSDLLDWPSDQFGLNAYLGPFGGNLYIVPGLAASHDPDPDITIAGAYLNLHYMLPTGDRLIPFVEGGVIGTAFRIDVLDRTVAGPGPEHDRTTYLRGGFQLGAGFDLALGANWSVKAGVRRVWLGDVDTELVLAADRVVSVREDPSYWELPRLAIVYWY